MRKTIITVLVIAAFTAPVALAGLATEGVGPYDIAERYLPRPAGIQKDMSFTFGPFVIPPGQDNNRISLDLPLHNGFFTAIAPNLIDATTGEEPSDLSMHIHHAHWFRLSSDPGDEYYTLNLAWIFGTGEEKTQGSFADRAAADPNGPQYGIFIPGGQPQAYIYMLHNKEASAKALYITLDVTFVYGTREEILAAKDCGPVLLENEVCLAGADFHEVKGRLWGSTFDVPRDFGAGDGIYTHPFDIPEGSPSRLPTDDLGRFFTAPHSGTLIATAGHMHPNGYEVILANIGPEGGACEGDLDGDGYPGVTLFHSRKVERNLAAAPFSEDYQMAATKFGFRAPIREGDRITQFAVYDNGRYASYEAMSYAGVYIDRLQVPAPRGDDEGCTVANTQAYFVGAPDGLVTEGIQNHEWGHEEPLCGLAGWPACDLPVVPKEAGQEVGVVHVGAFAYLPGDMDFDGALGAPPKVRVGESLTFVNEDVAGGIRHTVTSCEWPCNGPYVANYPQPSGVFDSGKLGNLDYIDGGITGDDTVPVWESPTDLAPGMYSYYCRIHPDMRGVFEVIPAR